MNIGLIRWEVSYKWNTFILYKFINYAIFHIMWEGGGIPVDCATVKSLITLMVLKCNFFLLSTSQVIFSFPYFSCHIDPVFWCHQWVSSQPDCHTGFHRHQKHRPDQGRHVPHCAVLWCIHGCAASQGVNNMNTMYIKLTTLLGEVQFWVRWHFSNFIPTQDKKEMINQILFIKCIVYLERKNKVDSNDKNQPPPKKTVKISRNIEPIKVNFILNCSAP